MSFLTLKSESQPSGKSVNNTDGANNFINHFNDPVVIRPGDTIELVSCSINKPDVFVVTPENNQFIFRRGYGLGDLADPDSLGERGTRFAQHVVEIPVGTYSGDQLATTIQDQLERNTLLLSFTDTWAVGYTAAVPPAPAVFQIVLGSAGLIAATVGTYEPSRQEALYEELAPEKITDPLTDITELTNVNYTDPFIATDIENGRSPIASKLNVNIGLQSTNFLAPTNGIQKARVKPVSICDGFTIEEPPASRPFGRVVTFDLPGLGTISNLSTTGNLNILFAGAENDYTNGEAVYLAFVSPDPFRPQRTGAGLYGIEYVTATAVVDPITNLLTGLTRTGNPQVGYKNTDLFSVLKTGGGSPSSPAVVSVNNGVTGITEINGSFYSDNVLLGLIAITQIPLGADPTAFGAQVFINSNVLGIGELTAAEITPAESDVMSTTNGVFSVGDLFLVDESDQNGIIRVASITPEPPKGDQFYFKNWNNDLGFDLIAEPVPLSPEAPAGWTHTVTLDEEDWYLKVHEDAAFVMSKNINNSIYNGAGNDWYKAIADPVELAAGKPFNTSCSWQKVRFGDDPAPSSYTTIFLTTDEGASTESVPLSFLKTYPQVQLGYCKMQMAGEQYAPVEGGLKYEENYEPYLYDLNLTFAGDLDSGVGGLKMTVIQQYGADNNTSFPDQGWSVPLALYEDVFVPFANPFGFIFGESEIEIHLQIDNFFNPIMEVNFLNAGVADTPAIVILDEPEIDTYIPPNYRSNLRELYYPLSAIIFYGEAYPFNIDALNVDNPGGVYGQTRLSYIVQGYEPEVSNWREENRGNMLWEIANDLDGDFLGYSNWNDDALQALEPGFNVGNQPIVLKFDKISPLDIQEPDGVTVLPPTQASGKISYFDASPGNPDRPWTIWNPYLTNGIGPLIGMPSFWQNPTPTPVIGLNGTTNPLVAPRQTIQVEVPEFNIKSWSGGSNDVGRAVGVIPAEQWDRNTDLTNDTLYYKSDYPKPVATNSQVTQPMYSLSCRLRDTEGKLIQDLKNPTTVTFMLKEGEESKQQRIMDNAMERVSAMKANNQENRISNANENMPRF